MTATACNHRDISLHHGAVLEGEPSYLRNSGPVGRLIGLQPGHSHAVHKFHRGFVQDCFSQYPLKGGASASNRY